MRLRVKICGIRTPEQAMMVSSMGADAIGLVLYEKSPRAVSLEEAIVIKEACPVWMSTVALMVNPSVNEVKEVIERLRPSYIQFHGDETPAFCEQFHYPYIRALPVGSHGMTTPSDIRHTLSQYPHAQAFIFDAPAGQHYGGQGKTFDHALLEAVLDAIPQHQRIIAGGVNANNIPQIVKRLQPYAVDLSSAVESEKGVKDPDKVKALMDAVHAVSFRG
ncbi:phosphoribosylanthranilate isomerase [Basilea psittacipulmonis]|uniref:N-(5'-phosphoribosyl)anthranilate isomerase n=1 Tax=Basilea psittacipulmonis DSM 24701 TaxID=1072685 RepID=A0A077DFF6_9BURK|nr:phosphoribosylanthranilate isomerase [Basilea psittacipulmonis]AIL32886.1 hypothetical protein IX83_05745 [Basilea psittacipulmonis DSM 24701]